MGDQLVPCPSCARHVRCSEQTCPFCGQAIAGTGAPCAPALSTNGPLTRAALLFAGATAAAACGSNAVPLYGPAPIEDAGKDAGPTDGAAVALYGPAPVDGGQG